MGPRLANLRWAVINHLLNLETLLVDLAFVVLSQRTKDFFGLGAEGATAHVVPDLFLPLKGGVVVVTDHAAPYLLVYVLKGFAVKLIAVFQGVEDIISADIIH